MKVPRDVDAGELIRLLEKYVSSSGLVSAFVERHRNTPSEDNDIYTEWLSIRKIISSII